MHARARVCVRVYIILRSFLQVKSSMFVINVMVLIHTESFLKRPFLQVEGSVPAQKMLLIAVPAVKALVAVRTREIIVAFTLAPVANEAGLVNKRLAAVRTREARGGAPRARGSQVIAHTCPIDFWKTETPDRQ